MNIERNEIIENLENLLEGVPYKIKIEIEIAINLLKSINEAQDFIKVQDQLEMVSNMVNLDSYTRSEIYNILSALEGLKI